MWSMVEGAWPVRRTEPAKGYTRCLLRGALRGMDEQSRQRSFRNIARSFADREERS